MSATRVVVNKWITHSLSAAGYILGSIHTNITMNLTEVRFAKYAPGVEEFTIKSKGCWKIFDIN